MIVSMVKSCLSNQDKDQEWVRYCNSDIIQTQETRPQDLVEELR